MQNRFDIGVLRVVMEEEKDREQPVRISTKQRGHVGRKTEKEKKRKREKEKKYYRYIKEGEEKLPNSKDT
jgi:hypothetical protein